MYRFSIASNKPRYGISNLELADGCFGFPLCDMNGAQVEAIRNDLIHQLARVVLYSVEMPVTETERYIRFFRNVHLIQAENVLLTDSAIANATDSDIQSIIRMGEAFSIRMIESMLFTMASIAFRTCSSSDAAPYRLLMSYD